MHKAENKPDTVLGTNQATIEPSDALGCEGAPSCSHRREFLVRATASAGGVVLALSGIKGAFAQTRGDAPDGAKPDAAAALPADELTLKLDGDSPLKAVGGSQTMDTAVGKVIVAHTAEATFVACSAVCTHRGGIVRYDAQSKEFACPVHGARFALDGSVVKPPARQPLKSFTPHSAVVVSLKPQV